MPQTILALLGLMLVAQFTLRQHSSILHGRLAMIKTEVSTIAGAVAVEHLERVAAMSFDDAAKEGRAVDFPSSLTARHDFHADAPNDDVDDFDGSIVTVSKTAGSDTLSFEVRTSVAYVAEFDPTTLASTPTKLKRLEVVVSSREIAFADTVKLERLVSCGSPCRW